MDLVEVNGPGELWDAVYRDLLEVSFPPRELDDGGVLAGRLADGSARATAIVDADGRPLAIAYGEWSSATRIQLLSYLAVAPGERGSGLGGKLLDAVVDSWREHFEPCAIVAEIEHPDWHASSEEHGDPLARMRFYARHGGRALDVPYFQPALREGASRAYGMILIALHIAPRLRGGAPGTFNPVALTAFLHEYFEETEGTPSEDDTPAQELLAAAEMPTGVRVLELTTDAPAGVE